MKRGIPILVLLVSFNVIFIAQAFAHTPEAVLNKFIARRQMQREARLSEKTNPHGLQSQIANAPDKQDSVKASLVDSSNWAGAIQVSPPSGEFNSISAQWTLPDVYPPADANGQGEWYSSEWVGIDGYTCDSAILQAGTYSYVQVDSSGGQTTGAVAWYEWYPNALIQFDGFSVNAGDTVGLSISATSNSEGLVVINNYSQGTTTSINLSAPSESNLLCGQNAEWILEDASSGGGLVPFSGFTDVYFTNCLAGTTTGATVDLTDATTIEIVQDYDVLATPDIVSNSELGVHYGS